MNQVNAFRFSQSGFSIVNGVLKKLLFQKVTAESTNLFIKGGDLISTYPQTKGIYEPYVAAFLNHCSKEGMSDFLIDIGANIGLISCQNGSAFDRVICFEPNPLCVHILKVNSRIALDSSKVQIYEYGLGEKDEEVDLWIPKHNWGGAFIRSNENSYTDGDLAAKDGFSEIDINNYTIATVSIRSAASCLKEIIDALYDENLKNGVVKIDVEGMEQVVLKGLATALPVDVNLSVVFENWDQEFDIEKVKGYFSNRKVSIGKIRHKEPYKEKWPDLFKGIAVLFGSRETYVGSLSNAEDLLRGEIVLTVR